MDRRPRQSWPRCRWRVRGWESTRLCPSWLIWTQSGPSTLSWRRLRPKPGPWAIPSLPQPRACAKPDQSNYGRLKIGNKGERSGAAKRHQIRGFPHPCCNASRRAAISASNSGCVADVVQHGCLDSAEAEIVGVSLDLYGAKIHSILFAEICARGSNPRGDLVNHRPAGIAQRQQSRHLVIGFACRIVARAPEAAISESMTAAPPPFAPAVST